MKEESEKQSEIKNSSFAYEILMRARDQDNQLMWTRSKILLIIQGAFLSIIVAKFEFLISSHPLVLVLICCFGLTISFLWFRITKGGSFWIDYWQCKMRKIEESVMSNIEIFRNHPSKETDLVKKKLLKKTGYISTRRTFIIVAFLSIILWTLFLVYILVISV